MQGPVEMPDTGLDLLGADTFEITAPISGSHTKRRMDTIDFSGKVGLGQSVSLPCLVFKEVTASCVPAYSRLESSKKGLVLFPPPKRLPHCHTLGTRQQE